MGCLSVHVVDHTDVVSIALQLFKYSPYTEPDELLMLRLKAAVFANRPLIALTTAQSLEHMPTKTPTLLPRSEEGESASPAEYSAS